MGTHSNNTILFASPIILRSRQLVQMVILGHTRFHEWYGDMRHDLHRSEKLLKRIHSDQNGQPQKQLQQSRVSSTY